MSDELTGSRWGASRPASLLQDKSTQLRLEASVCSAQELTAPDTESSSHWPRMP
jgi:hypothetical protein